MQSQGIDKHSYILPEGMKRMIAGVNKITTDLPAATASSG